MEAGTPITAALKEATSTIPIVFSPVCTENIIRVDDVMESPKLAE
jgi:ABC-type uncharacterized transport system substrate-binding protein